MSTPSQPAPIHHTDAELVDQANATGCVPVVFIHGLWLLPSSWDRWVPIFEDAGYAPLCPGWPDDPDTVAGAFSDPEVFANKTVGQIADHYAAIIGRLHRKPVVIGHSFGGLITQILAGRGLAAVSVAIDSAPFRGVLPLPISALRSAAPESEAKELFETFAVPAPGTPLFQAAAANLNPWTEANVDSINPDRGPMLIVSGELDHTVPRAISEAIYDRQRRNPGVTELVEMPGRGHSLTIDSGWHEVAETALAFVQLQTRTHAVLERPSSHNGRPNAGTVGNVQPPTDRGSSR